MKPKKLLMIGWFFYPKLGGVETVMLRQALYLVSQGYEVSVLTSCVDDLSQDDLQNGIHIYRRAFIDSSHDQTKKIVNELPTLLAKIKPDLIHFHNGSYPAVSSDMDAGAKNVCTTVEVIKKINIPIIEHAHNAQLKMPEKTQILRNLGWDGLIFVSRFVQNKWVKLGFKAKINRVIYNAVDVEEFQNSQKLTNIKQSNLVKIFFPSRIISMIKPILSEQKNFQLVIKACGELLKRGVSDFELIGVLDISLLAKKIPGILELKRLIKDSNLQNNLKFINNLSPLDMPKAYASIDVVCVPSIKEAFSLTYLETMAAGKIAIGTKTGGTPECIEDGVNGFLVDPEDANYLADILEKIIKNPNLIEIIGQKAREDVGNKFSLRKVNKDLINLYQEILCN